MTKEEHAKVLPPLPMPFIKLQGRNSRTKAQSEMMELFSADQMREYALAAIMRKEQEPVSDAEKWKQAVMLAYGHLWHVNNEPMAPIPLRSPEKAAYAARRVLLDLLTHEERGLAINEVRALLEKAR